jgi:protease IV
MGDVAASGGYWISMGADAIVAQPSTLTGSIGVLGGKLDIRGLYEWAGANVDSVKVGANADLMSAFRLFDTAQAERFKAWMAGVYDDFVHRVADGRGLKFEEVEPNAHGRVWSGAQAKERKLVDELGGMDKAIALAREKAKIPAESKVHLRRFPRRKGLFDMLAEGDFPMLRILAGLSDIDGTLDHQISEWETLQPWVLAPKIRIH